MNDGRYKTPPDMHDEEDKSYGMNVGCGREGEEQCPKTPPSKEATPSTEDPKDQAQEETHNRRADYPDVETFQEILEEERD